MNAPINAAQTARWHDRYPELGTGPIAVEPYISPAFFERERETIFRKVWLNVGGSSKFRRVVTTS